MRVQRLTRLPSQKGYSLSQKRIPLLKTPEKGLHWQLAGRRGAAPAEWKCLLFFAAIRLGVLLLPAAALLVIRQPYAITVYYRFLYKCATACQGGIAALAAVGTVGNNCIVDSRKLVCTETRYAERQRIIEAEASRISMIYGGERSNAATQALPLPSACTIADLQTTNAGLSLGGYKGGCSLSRKRTAPFTRAAP